MREESQYRFIVVDAENGVRLDAFLAARATVETDLEGLTRSYIQKLLDDGNATVNGVKRGKSHKLKTGDAVEACIPAPRELCAVAQDIPVDVVYEDNDLLVVYKPKGMVVHPAPGNPDGTLVNALLHHCKGSLSGINGVLRPGIVHRIDKDTSGLLVVAKNDSAHLSLSEQIAAHTVTRVYSAVVHGTVKEEKGTVDRPIGRSEKDRKKYCVTEKNAKHAVTHYEVVARFAQYTQLQLRLETGRTHQIRVHMASLGHPVAGDTVYGPKTTPKQLMGQCLHAGTLGFIHPRSGEYMEFTKELPAYFTAFLNSLC